MKTQAMEALNSTVWAKGLGIRRSEIIKLGDHESFVESRTTFLYPDGSKLVVFADDTAFVESGKSC